MDHFDQIIRKGKFAKYDFGAKINQIKYGSKQPPVYDLSKIQETVHLFVGEYDKLADVKDADRLYKELGSTTKVNNISIQNIKHLKFGHATFIWGKDASYLK